MAVGALLVIGGLVQTTSSTNGGNASPPAGTVLLAKFNYTNRYVFEKPAANAGVVTITNATATGATWHSSTPVSAIIVKGGTSSVIISFAAPQTGGTFSNAGLERVGNGKNLPAISNVQFCKPPPPHNTTTTKPPSTTTTTVPPTTTTTTVPETTTTTTVPETTTTTTVPETSPTVPPSTTTTTAPATTTTAAGSTTTQPVTTSTEVVGSSSGGTLPFTGGSSMPLIVLGIACLAGGFVLMLTDNRRRRRALS